MTKTNENQNENTLHAWATGKLSSIAVGLAVAYFIYKTGMINKVFDRFFKKDQKGKGADQSAASTSKDTR